MQIDFLRPVAMKSCGKQPETRDGVHISAVALPMGMTSAEKLDRISGFANDLTKIEGAQVIIAAFWINPAV